MHNPAVLVGNCKLFLPWNVFIIIVIIAIFLLQRIILWWYYSYFFIIKTMILKMNCALSTLQRKSVPTEPVLAFIQNVFTSAGADWIHWVVSNQKTFHFWCSYDMIPKTASIHGSFSLFNYSLRSTHGISSGHRWTVNPFPFCETREYLLKAVHFDLIWRNSWMSSTRNKKRATMTINW